MGLPVTGFRVGILEGLAEGIFVGLIGALEGEVVGPELGDLVGLLVTIIGIRVGDLEGLAEGLFVGLIGALEGEAVGSFVGVAVGDKVGYSREKERIEGIIRQIHHMKKMQAHSLGNRDHSSSYLFGGRRGLRRNILGTFRTSHLIHLNINRRRYTCPPINPPFSRLIPLTCFISASITSNKPLIWIVDDRLRGERFPKLGACAILACVK